jgi:long-chain acyl-CoA synthetase
MNNGPSGTMVAKGSTGDLMALNPTIMSCVPLILERIQKSIQNKIEERNPLLTELIKLCINYKNKWNLK